MLSAGVSSLKVISPGSAIRSSDCDTNHSKSSCRRSAKNFTVRSSLASAWIRACSIPSLMRLRPFHCYESLHLRQVLMHELDYHRSLAHAGSHALHRAVPHVAHNKNPRNVRFQQSRVAVERPGSGALAVAKKIGTGEHESPLIAFNQSGEPFRPRLRSDKNKQAGGGNLLADALGPARNSDAGQPRLAVHLDHA